MISAFDLPDVLAAWFDGVRLARRRRNATAVLGDWADRSQLRILEMSALRYSYDFGRSFGRDDARGTDRVYFEVTVEDDDHVVRSGVARVGDAVAVVWQGESDQRDWRDSRSPRGAVPGPHEQGWALDMTGRHELRWYSAGRPTDLVKDGATESRDMIGTESDPAA